jgi:hypothetical protein
MHPVYDLLLTHQAVCDVLVCFLEWQVCFMCEAASTAHLHELFELGQKHNLSVDLYVR